MTAPRLVTTNIENAAHPGSFETPMVTDKLANGWVSMVELVKPQPIGRLERPEEIAAAVLRLGGLGESFAIGHALVVDDGLSAR